MLSLASQADAVDEGNGVRGPKRGRKEGRGLLRVRASVSKAFLVHFQSAFAPPPGRSHSHSQLVGRPSPCDTLQRR